MYSYSIVQWLFFFYFYCFFGWCFESSYVSLKERKLVNRGFMRGPFLPLYGSGGIMMLVVSAPFQGNVLLVYLAGCVGATVLEYVTGVVMEALFKVRYWDYSNQKFQFQGHICLTSSLAWGFLTIFMTEWLHKTVEGFVLQIPSSWLEAIVFIITIVLAVDFTLSFKAAMDLRDILIKMEQAKEEMQRIQKRLDVIIAVVDEDINLRKMELTETIEQQKAEFFMGIEELRGNIDDSLGKLKASMTQKPTDYLNSVREEVSELRYKYRTSLEKREYHSRIKSFYQKKLMQAHPSMTSVRFKEALEELLEKLKDEK